MKYKVVCDRCEKVFKAEKTTILFVGIDEYNLCDKCLKIMINK